MVLTRDEAMVKEIFLPKLARVLARVPFAEDLLAAYFCAFDRATPARAKGILIGALAGFFVVPMNALLQHRGHILMGAGHSIAVQNFNDPFFVERNATLNNPLNAGAQFGGHSFDFRRQRTPCSHTLHHRCGRLQQLPQGC